MVPRLEKGIYVPVNLENHHRSGSLGHGQYNFRTWAMSHGCLGRETTLTSIFHQGFTLGYRPPWKYYL